MTTSSSSFPDLSTSRWTLLDDLAVPRQRAAVATVDENRLVVVGGRVVKSENADDEVTASGQVYHLKTNTWTPLNDMGTPREGYKAVCIDNKVYVLGGYGRESNWLRTMEVLDVETGEWTEETPFEGIYLHDFHVVAVGRWIYLVGSTRGARQRGERFHVDTQRWDTYPPWQRWVEGSIAVAMGTKIHVMGGWNATNQQALDYQMDVFDTVTQSWETLNTHSPRNRIYAQAVALAERYMIVMGGINQEQTYVGSVDIYDTQTNQWSSPLEATIGVHHMLAVLGKYHVILVGGNDGREMLRRVEQMDLWQLLPLPPAIPRAQRLFGDGTSGDDLLGVGEIARALADTIALKDLKPPFTTGILRQWGSGKSFFVELIKQRLLEIPEYDLTDAQIEANFPFVGHLYLVKFDVWTFAKGNLWASIMYQILVELNNQLNLEAKLRKYGLDLLRKGVSSLGLMAELSKGEQDYLRRLLQEDIINETLEKKLSTMSLNRTTATEALVKAVDLHYESDRQNLESLKAEHALAQLDLKNKKALASLSKDPASQSFRKRICSLLLFFEALTSTCEESDADGSFHDSVGTNSEDSGSFQANKSRNANGCCKRLHRLLIGDLSQERLIERFDPKQIKQGLQSLSWFLRSAVQVLSGDLSALWTFGLVVLTIVAFFVPDMLERVGLLGNVERFISFIAAAIPVAFGVSKLAKSTENNLNYINKTYTESFEQEIDLDTFDRQNTTSDNGTEPRTLSVIANEIAELEERLILVEGDSIDDVVRKRLESSGYQNHLGIVHKAQQDLERLSRAFLSEDAKAQSIFPRGKPRIVLVIDDLDRCPPDKVVETLEAAQLLVKTELFVVIMCIDTRYVSLALEKKYEGILVHQKRPSGMDYLEKIIQLPYRIPPIDNTDAMGLYLENQMGEVEDVAGEVPTSPPRNETQAPQLPAETPDQPTLILDKISAQPLAPSPEQSSQLVQPLAQLPASIELIPRTVALKFNKADLALLTTVCIAAGVSPRSGKRLVNVFKLLKLIWHRQDSSRTETRALNESVWFSWTRKRNRAERDGDARNSCLLLLAMCASPYKELQLAMGNLFESIERSRLNNTSGNLRDVVIEVGGNVGAIEPCRHLVDEWLSKVRWTNEEEWADIRQYLRMVRSFSFIEHPSPRDY